MKNRFASKTIIGFALVASMFAFGACSNDNSPADPGTPLAAPVLPNQSTMTMNLSFFGLDEKASSNKNMDTDAMLASAGDHSNWINAVVRALFVQLSFYDAFEEPIGAFAYAINSVPQEQPDGSWLWTFIFVEGPIEYSVFLSAMEVDDHIDWRLEVSSNDPALILDHFLWFDGQSQLDESSGYWQFYGIDEAPAAVAGLHAAAMTPGVPAVRIDWQHNGPNDNRLTILVNEVGGDDEGDQVDFIETPTSGSISYLDADVQENHVIRWNADGSGDITVPDYNGGLTACWDTEQVNTVCP